MPNYLGTGTGNSFGQEKIRKSQTVLNVDVSNLGRAKATPQLESIFFAGGVKKGKIFILNRENRRITVDPAKTERFEIESEEASSRINRRLDITNNGTGAYLSRDGSQSRDGSCGSSQTGKYTPFVHRPRATKPSHGMKAH